jgi:hypothetical protein
VEFDGLATCKCGTYQKAGGLTPPVKEYEYVHHPKHYNKGDIEHCEMVEDQGHADGYYFGQVTKYVFRIGDKPNEELIRDLAKTHWYAARWLAWRKHGKAIWKIVRRDPDIVFKPEILAATVVAEEKS